MFLLLLLLLRLLLLILMLLQILLFFRLCFILRFVFIFLLIFLHGLQLLPSSDAFQILSLSCVPIGITTRTSPNWNALQ